MRISELIGKLRDVQRRHGDIEIERFDGALLDSIQIYEVNGRSLRIVDHISLRVQQRQADAPVPQEGAR